MGKNKFTVALGNYSYKFNLLKFINKALYFCAIIYPMPSKLKARIFRGAGVRFKNIKKVFIGYNVWIDSAAPKKIFIGEHVILGTGCKIIAHSTGTFLQQGLINNKIEEVVIEDGVLVGINAIILPGVKIGKCAIVSAGSVVTRSVPEYSVVAGNPAKILKNLR